MDRNLSKDDADKFKRNHDSELKQKLGAILKVSMTWMSSFDFYVSFIKVIESWVMG